MQDLFFELKKMISKEQGRLHVALKYLGEGNFPDARALCISVLNENPELPVALLIVGYIHMQEGDFTKAIKACRLTLDLDPKLGLAHFILALIYCDLDQTQDALVECALALGNDAKKDIYYYLLGELYDRTGQYEAAMHAFQLVIESSPHNTLAHYKLANLFSRLNQQADAICEVETALRSTPSFNSYMILGNLCYKGENYTGALTNYYQAMSINPRHPDAHMKTGEVRTILGDYDIAIIELRTAIKIRSNHAVSYRLLGNVYFKLEQYQNAIDNFQLALKIDPGIPFLNADIGQAYAILGDFRGKYGGRYMWEKSAEAFRRFYEHSVTKAQSADKLYERELYAEAANEYRTKLEAETDWSPPEATSSNEIYVYDARGEGMRSRRRRYDYHFPVKLQDSTGTQDEGLTVNISKKGLLIESEKNLGIGSVLDLVFQFAVVAEPTTVRGKVIRNEPIEPGENTHLGNVQTGIELIFETEEEEQAWVNLLEM